MPQIPLDLPGSISKDVFEKDLSYYFGGDAEIVRQKGNHYVIDTSSSQNLQSILQRLRDDTATWRASDEYYQRVDYSQSKVHRHRKQSATSYASRYPSERRDSIASTMGTSSMPAPPRRPSMPHRNSSTSGSVIESPLGSSYQSTGSFPQSGMYSSSRRPSEATSPAGPGFRKRTDSMSSNSSDYGTDGYFGWKTSTGTDGYYGWRQDNGRSAPQSRRP